MEANYDWVENKIDKQIYTCIYKKFSIKVQKKQNVQIFSPTFLLYFYQETK